MTVVTNRSWRRSLILGLLIGLGLLILVLSQLSLKQAWQNLAQLDGRRLLLPLLVTLVCQPFRPWRWQAIFPKDVRPGFWSCFSVLAVGLMTNNFLPGRGGDLLRCFLVNRKVTLAGASLVLATLGLEKVLDGLALLAVVLLSFWFFSPPQWLGQLELASGLVFTGALGALLLLRYRTGWFLVMMRSLFRKVHLEALGEKLVTILAKFGEGLSILSSFRQTVKAFGLTIMVWAAEAVLIWGLAWSLQISLSVPAAMVVTAFLGLGGMILPAAPGSIGTYEFFSITALKLFGISTESALALTLVMHAWSFIATTLLGLVGLWMSGISFSQWIRGRSPEQPIGE
jgi:uncharacterized protein (TIRG00374 family)